MKILLSIVILTLAISSSHVKRTPDIYDPFQLLKYYRDSSETLLKKGICPDLLYDPCLDYRREFIRYHTCVWNLKTQKQEFCLCTDRVLCSFKKDLIDSIKLDYLKDIIKHHDTLKLNKKCDDSLHLKSEPNICREFSTLDLIKIRLKTAK